MSDEYRESAFNLPTSISSPSPTAPTVLREDPNESFNLPAAPVSRDRDPTTDPQVVAAIDRAPDPQRARQTYDLAVSLKEGMGIPFGAAFSAAQGIVDSPDPKKKSFGQALIDEWKTARVDVQAGMLKRELRHTTDESKRAELTAAVKAMEAERPASDRADRNAAVRGVLGAGNMVGQMAQTAGAQVMAGGRPELTRDILTTMAQFTRNALTFQWGKQAQLVTKAVAEATGMGRLESGNAYWDMTQAGVPEEIAGPISDTVGALNSVVEFASDAFYVSLFTKVFGTQLAKGAVKALGGLAEKLGWQGGMTRLALRIVGKVVAGTAGNMAEEYTQETMTFLAEEAAVRQMAEELMKDAAYIDQLSPIARERFHAQIMALPKFPGLVDRYKQLFGELPGFVVLGLLPGLTEGVRSLPGIAIEAKAAGAKAAPAVTAVETVAPAVELPDVSVLRDSAAEAVTPEQAVAVRQSAEQAMGEIAAAIPSAPAITVEMIERAEEIAGIAAEAEALAEVPKVTNPSAMAETPTEWGAGAPVYEDASPSATDRGTADVGNIGIRIRQREEEIKSIQASIDESDQYRKAWEMIAADPQRPTKTEIETALDRGIIPPLNNDWEAQNQRGRERIAELTKEIAELRPQYDAESTKIRAFETGNPVVVHVYHGTPFGEIIEGQFRPELLGTHTGAPSSKQGYFFAGRMDTAESYAFGNRFSYEGWIGLSADEKAQVIAALKEQYYSLSELEQKEMDFDEWVEANPYEIQELAHVIAPDKEFSIKKVAGAAFGFYLNLKNPLVKDFRGESYRDESYYHLIQKAIDAGHDSVIFKNTHDWGGGTKPKDITLDNVFVILPGYEKQIRTEQSLTEAPVEEVALAAEAVAPAEPAAPIGITPEQARATVQAGEWLPPEDLGRFSTEPWAQEELNARGAIRAVAESVAAAGGDISALRDELDMLSLYSGQALAGPKVTRSAFVKSEEYTENIWSEVKQAPTIEPEEDTPAGRTAAELANADARIDNAIAIEEMGLKRFKVDDVTATTAELYTGGIDPEAENVGAIVDEWAGLEKEETDPETELIIRKRHDAVTKLTVALMRQGTPAMGGRALMALEDFQAKYATKNIRTFEALRKAIKEWAKAHPGQPMLPDAQRVLDMQSLRDMTIGELRAAAKQAEQIRKDGLEATKAARTAEKKLRVETTEKVLEQLQKVEPKRQMPEMQVGKEYEKARRTPGRKLPAWLVARPNRWAMWLDGGKKGINFKMLYGDINAAWSEEKLNVLRRVQASEAQMKKLGVTVTSLKRTFRVGGQLTNANEALAVYLYAQNPDAKADIVNEKGNNISEERVAEFTAKLTDAERAFGDWMLEQGDGPDTVRLRDFSLDKLGIPFRKVQNYFPMSVRDVHYEMHAKQIEQDLLNRSGVRRAGLAKGMLKERTGKIAPLNLNAMATFLDSIEKQEHLMSHADAVKMMWSVYGNKKVQAEFMRAFGKEALTELKSYMANVTNPVGGYMNDVLQNLSNRVRGNLVVSGIVGNVRSLMKNLPMLGMLNYHAYAPAPFLISAMGQWMGNLGIPGQDAHSLYTFVTSRDPQQADRVIDPVYTELKHHEWSKGKQGLTTVMKFLARFNQELDTGTILVGWKAVYDYAKWQGKSEQEAIDAAQDATLRVQPQGAPKDLPAILRDPVGKWLSLFGNQTNQNLNMLAFDMSMTLKNAEQKKIARGLKAYRTAAGLVATSILLGVIQRKRGPKNKKEWALDIASTFITPVPIAGDELMSMIEGRQMFGSQSAYSGIIRNLGAAVKEVQQGDVAGTARAMLMLIPEALRILGGPAALTSSVIKSILRRDAWWLIGGPPEG